MDSLGLVTPHRPTIGHREYPLRKAIVNRPELADVRNLKNTSADPVGGTAKGPSGKNSSQSRDRFSVGDRAYDLHVITRPRGVREVVLVEAIGTVLFAMRSTTGSAHRSGWKPPAGWTMTCQGEDRVAAALPCYRAYSLTPPKKEWTNAVPPPSSTLFADSSRCVLTAAGGVGSPSLPKTL